jgi:hypothetical protein
MQWHEPSTTYNISTWDHEAHAWDVKLPSVPWLHLKNELRALEAEGWGRDVSILVERNWERDSYIVEGE